MASQLRGRVELPPSTLYRLVGVGMSNFPDGDEGVRQVELFGAEPEY
jgi:DNA polymerase-4